MSRKRELSESRNNANSEMFEGYKPKKMLERKVVPPQGGTGEINRPAPPKTLRIISNAEKDMLVKSFKFEDKFEKHDSLWSCRMKIIFLDIDGVLNTYDWSNRDNEAYDLTQYQALSPSRVSLLNELIARTGAKIVLSSSLRGLFRNEIQSNKFFIGYGVEGNIIGHTPNTQYGWTRGNEIREWLNQNMEMYNGVYSSLFTDYVILDAEADMLLEQKDNFVHVNGKKGLTREDVEKAVEILGQ